MTNPTPTVARSRRAFLRSAVVGAAGTALGATVALPAVAAARSDDSRLIAMIAEEERLSKIAAGHDRQVLKFINSQDDIFYWYDHLNDLPEPVASQYRESKRWFDAANEIARQIEGMKPTTAAGCIALLKWVGDGPATGAVIAWLREKGDAA